MSPILEFLKPGRAAGLLPSHQALDCARRISSLTGVEVYPRSLASADGTIFGLGRTSKSKILLLLKKDQDLGEFQGLSERVPAEGREIIVARCELSQNNAAALRGKLTFLNPRTIGLSKSAGCGAATWDVLLLSTANWGD